MAILKRPTKYRLDVIKKTLVVSWIVHSVISLQCFSRQVIIRLNGYFVNKC